MHFGEHIADRFFLEDVIFGNFQLGEIHRYLHLKINFSKLREQLQSVGYL
jgi:hypothetical protein